MCRYILIGCILTSSWIVLIGQIDHLVYSALIGSDTCFMGQLLLQSKTFLPSALDGQFCRNNTLDFGRFLFIVSFSPLICQLFWAPSAFSIWPLRNSRSRVPLGLRASAPGYALRHRRVFPRASVTCPVVTHSHEGNTREEEGEGKKKNPSQLFSSCFYGHWSAYVALSAHVRPHPARFPQLFPPPHPPPLERRPGLIARAAI